MRVPGVPYDQGDHPKGTMTPIAGVLHRTYGGWGGSYGVGKHGNPNEDVGFALLVGKRDGQWEQFYDTTTVTWHAGSRWGNWHTFGIEFEGVNEEPLTDWQVRAGAWIIALTSHDHNLPRTFLPPNAGRREWHGFMSHANVPSASHTDWVSVNDWNRMMALLNVNPPAPAPPSGPNPTADFLRAVAAEAESRPTLHIGDSGPLVSQLQDWLNTLCGARLMVDGKFGPATERWVRQYQTDRNLKNDGVVGVHTWARLIAERLARR